ncbi:colipase-like protein 2 isoform X2 [Rhinolophus sinicus]|uniref:colipase-like protein 2 isoform X2 n=1 Tax=Rhinolophus sinicus TaxID=89399 RepID=UPI003D794333
MAAAFLLLAGVLLPCWAAFPQVKRWGTKINGAGCAHHAECFSDCCLMDLDHGGSFCAPKTKIATVCLPQMVKLRLQEVMKPAQDHTASKLESWA